MKNMYPLVRITTQHLGRLSITAALFSVPNAFADTIVLKAIDDFPERFAGDAPFYAEPARDALAINAVEPTFRNVFAKATTTFSGPSGEYDVALIGLAELDGEALYRFSVNDDVLGSAQNSETSVDYMPMDHRFESITLSPGDVLSVESVANSNDLIPEGNGYAFARGRWTELRLTPVGESDVQPEKVSLITNASSLNQTIEVGQTIAIDYAVINDDTAGATATNLRIQFNIPDNFEITEPNTCTTIASLHSNEHIIRCSTSQVAPGNAVSGELFLTALEQGTELNVHATSIANETEISGFDNRDTVSFTIEALPTEEATPAEAEEASQETNTNTTIDAGDSANTSTMEPIAENDEPSESLNEETPDNSSITDIVTTEADATSNPTEEESSNTSILGNESSQTLPEIEVMQLLASTGDINQTPITTGGVLNAGAGIVLLLFNLFNVRRSRQ